MKSICKYFLFVTLTVCMSSCSLDKYSLDVPNNEGQTIPAAEAFRSQEEVRSIALGAKEKFYPQTKSSPTTIKDITPYVSSATKSASSDTLMYIVNYNDGGFSLIAANRFIEPILVVTESGSFDGTQTDCEPFNMYFEELSGQLAMLHSPGILPPIEQPIADTLRYSVVNMPPLLETEWHQYSPFNIYCPLLGGANIKGLVGCGPLALGQIMAYYEYPNNINITFSPAYTSFSPDWDIMKPNTTAPAQHQTALLLREIGKQMNADYCFENNTINTKTRPIDAYYAAPHFGYSADYPHAYDGSTSWAAVADTIALNRPVLFFGFNEGDDANAHSWIADGWQKTDYSIDYCRNIFNWDGSRPVVSHDEETTFYFHFNIGYPDTNFNGYYIAYHYINRTGILFVEDYVATVISIFDISDVGGSNTFNHDVLMMTNLYPNAL